MKLLPALISLIGAMAIITSSASASAQTDTKQPAPNSNITVESPLLSEKDFHSQRDYMIKDTAAKILVLQAAHDCAEAAKTPAAFAECNQKLREAILRKPEN